MIKESNGKWNLFSKDGTKHLGGPYSSREEAVKRERQVEFFKHQHADGGIVTEDKMTGVELDSTNSKTFPKIIKFLRK